MKCGDLSHDPQRVWPRAQPRGEADDNCLSSFGIDALRQLLIVQK